MELEVLKKAITKVLQVYISEIQEDSTFEGDLGADSIDMMQIQKCVEDELGITIKMPIWKISRPLLMHSFVLRNLWEKV